MEAAAPVFQGLQAERPALPTVCWAGPSHLRSCWRIPMESNTLRWDALSIIFLLSFSTSSGILKVLRCGIYVSVRVLLHSPSWGLRWVRRTFYSGRLVRSSGKSQPPPWVRYGDIFYLFTQWIILCVNCDELCCCVVFYTVSTHFTVLFPWQDVECLQWGKLYFNTFFLFCFYYITILWIMCRLSWQG